MVVDPLISRNVSLSIVIQLRLDSGAGPNHFNITSEKEVSEAFKSANISQYISYLGVVNITTEDSIFKQLATSGDNEVCRLPNCQEAKKRLYFQYMERYYMCDKIQQVSKNSSSTPSFVALLRSDLYYGSFIFDEIIMKYLNTSDSLVFTPAHGNATPICFELSPDVRYFLILKNPHRGGDGEGAEGPYRHLYTCCVLCLFSIYVKRNIQGPEK